MTNHDDLWEYWNKTKDGIPEDLSSINEETKKELLKSWEDGVWTENKPSSDEILENIKLLPKIELKVTKWVMDIVKQCTDDFVKQKWFSSIALAGAICEYHVFYLIEKYIKNNGIYPVVQNSGLLKQQADRIVLIRKLDIISEQERASLKEINDIRNRYLHIHITDYSNIKDDTLKIVQKTIKFLENHPI